MKNKIELRTERLVLRPVETNKYQGWIPKIIDDVDSFLNKISPEIDIADTWFQFVIVEIKNSKIIGDLGIHFIDDEQAEIGCTLAKKHHGKGYATEALKSVMDYLFNKLNCKIFTRCLHFLDKNTQSISQLESNRQFLYEVSPNYKN